MSKGNLLPRSLREEKNLRWRGGEVSRIEGLSDAVFALSLTLAVFVPNVAALSGLVYFLMGPAQGINGYLTGVAVERAAENIS